MNKEVQAKLVELQEKLRKAEIELVTEKLKDTSVLKKTRKEIARLLTNLKKSGTNE